MEANVVVHNGARRFMRVNLAFITTVRTTEVKQLGFLGFSLSLNTWLLAWVLMVFKSRARLSAMYPSQLTKIKKS